MVVYLEIGGLKIKILFNKNIIKLRNNKEYIKEAINIIIILYIKLKCNCKNNILIIDTCSLYYRVYRLG